MLIKVGDRVYVQENADGGTNAYFVGPWPWIGVVAERMNNHEFAVVPEPPFRLKPGHTQAMLSRHDLVKPVDQAVLDHTHVDMVKLAIEAETLRVVTEAVDLASDCCQPFDHHGGKPCSACWVQYKLLEKYPQVRATANLIKVDKD